MCSDIERVRQVKDACPGYGLSWHYLKLGMSQILLFGVMAVEIKRKAPRAHTVLELVRKRWGHAANIVCPASIPHPLWQIRVSAHDTCAQEGVTAAPLMIHEVSQVPVPLLSLTHCGK